jgi:hypothetical protein
MTPGEQTIMDLVAVNDKGIVQSPEWWKKLKDAVNNLIIHDFSRLVQLLYQADVPEEKLKRLLKEKAGSDAAEIITGLLLQRQLQKIEARKQFSKGFNQGSSEEQW